MANYTCFTDGANPNCTCPSHTSKELIRKNAFGENNPTEDRYFCSYISEDCKRKTSQGNPNHSSCSCLRNNGYVNCVCPGKSQKVYFPYGTVPGFPRDEINCCGDSSLHSKLLEKCEMYRARYGKLPISVATPIEVPKPVLKPAPAAPKPAPKPTPAAPKPAPKPTPAAPKPAPKPAPAIPKPAVPKPAAPTPPPAAPRPAPTAASRSTAVPQPALVAPQPAGPPKRGYGRGNTGVYAASAAGGTTALSVLGLGLMLLL